MALSKGRDEMTDTTSTQTFGFQAEVKQLLHLMIHSLYSNRDVFLRELISNASDANDKLRFEALSSPTLLEDSGDLRIDIAVDKEARTISISDNGIGMTRDEVIADLGTIARSGTAQYLERLSGDQRKDSQLIGQFGVGFYSAFIVAETVVVQTRKAGQPSTSGVRWQSDGQGEFSVESIDRAERGTTVSLTLRENASEFLDEHRLRDLVHKYSDHIAFPVRLRTTDSDPETINRAKALWARPRGEISDEEYSEFYKHISHDFGEPLAWSHNRVEGKREYTSLLYIPGRAPFDLWNRELPRGVKLFVQRVFITDEAEQFLPLYLRFVRGVLDTDELPLNVSREMLQDNPAVAAIRSALTKRVLDMLEKLAGDADKYAQFWREFGVVVKEGLVEDAANRPKLLELSRFCTTRSEDEVQNRSLAQYVEQAVEGQESIYYLLAESPTAARSSPHLEAFRDRGIEVLLLADRLDPWVIQHVTEYGGKPLVDVSRGDLELPQDATTPNVHAEPDKDEKQLLKRIKRALRERVGEVRATTRLKESAARIVLGEQDIGHQMRELLKAAGHDAPGSAPNLEINMSHPLLLRMVVENDELRLERFATLLLDEAVLADGRQLDDPAGFVRRVNEVIVDLAEAASRAPAERGAASEG
jgi:molecular chaperone HtpG